MCLFYVLDLLINIIIKCLLIYKEHPLQFFAHLSQGNLSNERVVMFDQWKDFKCNVST